jgi:hypothetical protein
MNGLLWCWVRQEELAERSRGDWQRGMERSRTRPGAEPRAVARSRDTGDGDAMDSAQ